MFIGKPPFFEREFYKNSSVRINKSNVIVHSEIPETVNDTTSHE